jgi:hypothetical protein
MFRRGKKATDLKNKSSKATPPKMLGGKKQVNSLEKNKNIFLAQTLFALTMQKGQDCCTLAPHRVQQKLEF